MLQQAALTGPPPPLHTTSDLLRLLAADAHPFAAVAEAVAARFGGSAESQAWLARTLVTLLRDGLLYTEAEKMNAAYLLRFSAPGTAGSREALLHLALPDGGEPPAVRAWAAALAQPLPGEAHASGSSLGSLGSLGSAGSSPAASPSWQEQQARAAGAAAAALLHQRTPRQVLAETAAAQDARSQHGQPLPIAPSPQLPWQASVNLSAAAAAPPPASFDALPGSPSLAPSVPLWLQPQQPLSPTSAHRVGSPLAAPAQHSPASFSPRLLSPPSAHPAHALLAHSPPLAPLQPLPPPLQPLVLEPAALGSFAAQQLQQQPQVPPLLQQQREQEELGPLHALLQQAAQAALVPAKQQQLVAALGGPLAPRLTAPLAAAVGAAGGAPGRLQPHHMHGLVEQNCPVASQLLLALLTHHPEAAAVFSAAVAEVPMSAQSVECLSAVVAGGGALPGWVLATFLANCMQDISSCVDPGRQSRHVKLLCACVALVLQRQPHALAESLPELLSFCIEQSRHKQAADLYRQLRGLEAAAG